MAQRRTTLEIKVGAFVVAGVALLIVFIFTIGDFSTYFQPGYQLRVVFESANGLTEGSPVQYAGVEVGKVQTIRFTNLPDTPVPHVEVLVRLPQSVKVRTDDVAAISTFGLLGEKYLAISPGLGAGEVLTADGQLAGRPPVSTDKIIERSDQVLTELQQTLAGVNSLVGDPEARIFLKETLQEARDATRNWKTLGDRLNRAMYAMETGEGSMGKLLFSDDLYLRVVSFVEDLRAHPWKLLVRPTAKK